VQQEAALIALDRFLVITPICPDETAQPDAAWDIDIFPNILAQVAVQYNVDLTRIYLSTYSMGARAAWNLLMKYPDIFAGSVISSGATYADASLLKNLLGNSIRNYYGTVDEFGLFNATLDTQQRWNQAAARYIQSNSSSIYRTRVLETVGPIQGADHLVMNERPWDEDVITDGYAGALAWLLGQRRLEGGQS
jgi:predicted peptidase